MCEDDSDKISRDLELLRQNSQMIGDAIRSAFDDTLNEPIPAKLKDLIAELRKRESENR